MIYLDTSAFIKLYLHEDGSAEVHGLVVAQREPLPVWHFMELEFLNALRFKVFLDEMSPNDVERVISLWVYHPYTVPMKITVEIDREKAFAVDETDGNQDQDPRPGLRPEHG